MQTTTSWEERGIEKGMEKGAERERRSLAKPLEENCPQSPTTRSLYGFDRPSNRFNDFRSGRLRQRSDPGASRLIGQGLLDPLAHEFDAVAVAGLVVLVDNVVGEEEV
jgi:hypothetical protein